MAGNADRQRQHALGPPRFGRLAGALHGFGLARDDDLPGRVVVDRLDDRALRRFPAGRFDVGVGKAEYRGHLAGALGHGFLHHLAAELHHVDGSREVQRAGGDERGELAEAVAGHGGRFCPAPLRPQSQDRDARREQRGLSDFRKVEAFLWAFLR